MNFRKLLLVSALALPLMSAGAAWAGETEHPDNMKPMPDRPHPCMMHDMMKGENDRLPEATRKIVHEEMEKGREEHKSTFEAIMRTHKELQALMASPNFSRDEFMKKSVELENLKTLAAQQHAETLATIAEKLTPEDRKIFAEHMHPMMPMPPHHGDWKDAKHGQGQHRHHEKMMNKHEAAPAPAPQAGE